MKKDSNSNSNLEENLHTSPGSFYKKFAAMAAGNVMEWFFFANIINSFICKYIIIENNCISYYIMKRYDFAVFGAVADIIAQEFFPSGSSDIVRIMQSFSVFGSAFLMRPLGGILMGFIGDTVSRKRQLELSVLMMLLPTLVMGCLPTYEQLGISATLLLVLMRLIQGLAVGGELVGAYIYTLEAANGKNKGFWGFIIDYIYIFFSNQIFFKKIINHYNLILI